MKGDVKKTTVVGRTEVIAARVALAWMPLNALQEAIQMARVLLPLEAAATAKAIKIMRANGFVTDPAAAVRALMVLARHEAENAARNRV